MILSLQTLISHKYPFSELHIAMKKTITDKAGAFKVMITFY